MKMEDLREIVSKFDFFTGDLDVRVRAGDMDAHLFPEVTIEWKAGTPTLYLEAFIPNSKR